MTTTGPTATGFAITTPARHVLEDGFDTIDDAESRAGAIVRSGEYGAITDHGVDVCALLDNGETRFVLTVSH